jgi:hypothetical protein
VREGLPLHINWKWERVLGFLRGPNTYGTTLWDVVALGTHSWLIRWSLMWARRKRWNENNVKNSKKSLNLKELQIQKKFKF